MLRDSHNCGVDYGKFDFARYKNIFQLKKTFGDTIDITIDRNDIHIAESILIARYHYNLQVIYHRTRIGYNLVLEKFIQEIREEDEGKLFKKINDINELDMNEFVYSFDDYDLFQLAKKNARTSYWSKYMLREKHLMPLLVTRPVYETKGRKLVPMNDEANLFENFVDKLKNEGEDGRDYFIYSESTEVIKHKRDFFVTRGDFFDDMEIKDYSSIFEQLNKSTTIAMVYAKYEEKESQKYEKILQSIRGK